MCQILVGKPFNYLNGNSECISEIPVGQDDLSGVIKTDDRDRNGIDDGSEQPFMGLDIFFCPFRSLISLTDAITPVMVPSGWRTGE